MSRRHRFVKAALITGVALLGVGLAVLVQSPQQARACAGPPAGGTGTVNCGPTTTTHTTTSTPPQQTCGTWKTPPRLVIHYGELSSGQSRMTYTLNMIAAVEDVVNAFNKVGGTSARVQSVESTTEPFVFGHWYHDTTPTIHVGFAPNMTAWNDALGTPNPGARGLTTNPSIEVTQPLIDNCWYLERHIVFPDTSIRFSGNVAQPWSFGAPPLTTSTTATKPYYDAGSADTTANVTTDTQYKNEPKLDRLWFRPAFLHELLHAFGMTHHNDYSMMTAGIGDGFPWANRPVADMVRPLPADIMRLRNMYPATVVGAVYDVSVLNTWDEPNPDNPGESKQVALCQPSTGSSWSTDIGGIGFGYCGVSDGNPAQGCPGDTLYTRFAIANGSTESVDLKVKLAFSKDEQWGGSDDVLSPSGYSVDKSAEDSKLMELTWKVPPIDTSNTHVVWHPLVQISGDHVDTDWIPFRGTLGVPFTGC
jgi:hypothetical protein